MSWAAPCGLGFGFTPFLFLVGCVSALSGRGKDTVAQWEGCRGPSHCGPSSDRGIVCARNQVSFVVTLAQPGLSYPPGPPFFAGGSQCRTDASHRFRSNCGCPATSGHVALGRIAAKKRASGARALTVAACALALSVLALVMECGARGRSDGRSARTVGRRGRAWMDGRSGVRSVGLWPRGALGCGPTCD